MRSKRPFRSLIVCVSCAMVGCILTSTAYSRRVNDLETERDIYASKSSNWERMAGERDETIDQLQTEVDKLTAELNAQTDLTLTYGGFIAPDGRKLKGEDFKKENAKIFAALPMVVQRWAGSPADLSEIFSSRSSADPRCCGC